MTISNICLVVIALIAFASNSLLCRAALYGTNIDPATFTAIRLTFGAIVLCLLVSIKQANPLRTGSIKGTTALFIYATAFSFAYVNMSTGTGALLLFGSVQITMIIWGLKQREYLSRFQLIGFILAIAGLIILLFPGVTAPPIYSAVLMIIAGLSWGIYTILGKGATAPLTLTAGNFIYTLPLVIALLLFLSDQLNIDKQGAIYAALSGGLASGVGYAIWYKVLPHLKSMYAGSIQLCVPVIAAVMGYIFLNESLSLRMLVASIAILGGIFMVIYSKTKLNPI